MAMRGALLAAAVLLRGCRGQQTTVLTVGGLFPTSQGDATNEDFNDDRRQAEAALAAINAVNADASVLPGVQLAFLAQDIAALRTLNSNSENFFQRQMAEEVAGDIAAVFRQADAVGVVGAGWSSDVKVLAPALGSLPLVSHSAACRHRPSAAETIVVASVVESISQRWWSSPGRHVSNLTWDQVCSACCAVAARRSQPLAARPRHIRARQGQGPASAPP